jgi:hypothetical protein
MAYSTLLPPVLTGFTGLTRSGNNQNWLYKEAATFDTIRAAGYISNALDLGMKVGDIVEHWDSTSASAPVVTLGRVTAVSSTGATIAATGTPIV